MGGSLGGIYILSVGVHLADVSPTHSFFSYISLPFFFSPLNSPLLVSTIQAIFSAELVYPPMPSLVLPLFLFVFSSLPSKGTIPSLSNLTYWFIRWNSPRVSVFSIAALLLSQRWNVVSKRHSQTECRKSDDRAFSVTGPHFWNDQPQHVRESSSVDSSS